MHSTVVKYTDEAQQPTLLFIPYWVRATLKREGKGLGVLSDKQEMARLFSSDDLTELRKIQHDILDVVVAAHHLGVDPDSDAASTLRPHNATVITATPAIDLLNEYKESEKTNNKSTLNYERLIGRTLGDNQFVGFKLIDVPSNDRTYVGFTTYVIEGTIHDMLALRKQFIVNMIHALWAHGFPLSKLVQLGLFRHYTI